MSVDLIIRGGQVVTPDGVRRADVLVENGTIVEVTEAASPPAKGEIDATGLHVFPGVVDPHVHFNEPGRADWEGFSTGSAALAAGGGTLFFDMPLNSSPPVLDGAAFDAKVAAGTGQSYADFALWGGIVPQNLGKLAEMADRGVVGFKAFISDSGIGEFPRTDDVSLFRAMKIAAGLGLPVAVHAESEVMTAFLTREARAAGGTSAADYVSTRPMVAEIGAIQRAILFAEETGCRLHVVHVSGPRGVEVVRRAKAAGDADVTCETCPHYLTFTEDDLTRVGAALKCAPPLRSAEDVNALWRDLAAGTIAFVASDHSPAPASMKSSDDFFEIWGGVAGVQSTLAVLLTRRPPLPPARVARLVATAAVERFGIGGKGRIEAGCDADLALVDVGATYTLRRDDLLDRHQLSPYVGRTFTGRVTRTILRGRTIHLDGKAVGPPTGRLVKPRPVT